MQWVVEGVLASSSRPGRELGDASVPKQIVDDWIEAAKRWGIQSIICLLDAEHLSLYGSLPGGLLGYYKQHGFQVASVPSQDYQPIPHLRLREIGTAYETLAKPVLVHCSGGVGRTGMAIEYLLAEYHATDRDG